MSKYRMEKWVENFTFPDDTLEGFAIVVASGAFIALLLSPLLTASILGFSEAQQRRAMVGYGIAATWLAGSLFSLVFGFDEQIVIVSALLCVDLCWSLHDITNIPFDAHLYVWRVQWLFLSFGGILAIWYALERSLRRTSAPFSLLVAGWTLACLLVSIDPFLKATNMDILVENAIRTAATTGWALPLLAIVWGLSGPIALSIIGWRGFLYRPTETLGNTSTEE